MARMKAGEVLSWPQPQTSIRSSRMDDAQIVQSIAEVWRRWGYVADPHTACAFTDMAPEGVSVILSTASAAKFPEVVAQALGREVTHPTLEALKGLPLRSQPLAAEPAAVKAFVRAHLGA
jgi:threonine synthase